MRKQKIVALLTLTALCLSMPGVASAQDPSDNAAGVSKDLDTTGTVNYADTEIYSVTLPTDGCFDFVVDPQGILSATAPSTYTEEMYPDGTAGYIVATEGTGAYINNKSAVPIKLSLEAYVAKDAAGAASTVNLVDLDRADSMNAGIDNNMMLTFDITHDGVDQTTFADATAITTENVNPDVIAVTKNGKPDTTNGEVGTKLSFALAGAKYNYTGSAGAYTYEIDSADTTNVGDSVGVRLGGLVNTEADWSAYTGDSGEPIHVATTFSFDKLSYDYDYAPLDGRAHGVLADVEPQYFAGVDESTGDPVAEAMDCAAADAALDIPFDFGAGTKEVTVTGITIGASDTAVAATDYRVKNSVISFKTATDPVKTELATAAAAAATAADGYSPVTVKITTSDTKVTTVTLNVY